jgi:hypothetical protein
MGRREGKGRSCCWWAFGLDLELHWVEIIDGGMLGMYIMKERRFRGGVWSALL